MIKLNKAVIHILDMTSTIKVFSDRELDVEDDCVKRYLSRHIKKLNDESNFKAGIFNENSKFKEQLLAYKNDNGLFIEFSKFIAEKIYDAVGMSDKINSADVIVCDYAIDEVQKIAVLKCNNKIGYVHQVLSYQGGVANEIINHFAILPNTSQKIDECAIINLENMEIRFRDKSYNINGVDVNMMQKLLLECSGKTSPAQSVKQMNEIVEEVAQSHGENPVEAVAKAKLYIHDSVEQGRDLDIAELGKEVFAESEAVQEAYAAELCKTEIPEVVALSRSLANKSGKTHKIKTDTGIELSVPVDYYQNKDYMEFINNPDGTISISLKNIGEIINK